MIDALVFNICWGGAARRWLLEGVQGRDPRILTFRGPYQLSKQFKQPKKVQHLVILDDLTRKLAVFNQLGGPEVEGGSTRKDGL